MGHNFSTGKLFLHVFERAGSHPSLKHAFNAIICFDLSIIYGLFMFVSLIMAFSHSMLLTTTFTQRLLNMFFV